MSLCAIGTIEIILYFVNFHKKAAENNRKLRQQFFTLRPCLYVGDPASSVFVKRFHGCVLVLLGASAALSLGHACFAETHLCVVVGLRVI